MLSQTTRDAYVFLFFFILLLWGISFSPILWHTRLISVWSRKGGWEDDIIYCSPALHILSIVKSSREKGSKIVDVLSLSSYFLFSRCLNRTLEKVKLRVNYV